MTLKKLMVTTVVVGSVLGAVLTGVVLSGCTGGAGAGETSERTTNTATVQQSSSEQEDGHSGGEHGSNGESGNERGESGSEGGNESREAEMSSPIVPLGESWDGALGGLAVSARFDAATETVHTTVRNTLSETLCYVQSEPHLKSGTRTVGELGPDKLGDLSPGQEATSSLSVAAEPELAGVGYDGYVVHLEVFDCGGPGPVAHSGEDGEEGGEHGSGGEEGSRATMLAPDETYDAVRSGAHLILRYDPASNSFAGTVENTTNEILRRVRIEVHLSNGAELGPTTPTDLAPGEVLEIHLSATTEPFSGWTTHAEVGGGEGGGESSGSQESGNEHDRGSESGGEHGSAGEHGSGGERGG